MRIILGLAWLLCARSAAALSCYECGLACDFPGPDTATSACPEDEWCVVASTEAGASQQRGCGLRIQNLDWLPGGTY